MAKYLDIAGLQHFRDKLRAWLGFSSSNVLPASHGGTGVTSNPSMLVNLGSTSAASVFQASPRPGVTGILATRNGGTGQTSLQATRNAMGLGNTTGALPVSNGGTGSASATSARRNLEMYRHLWSGNLQSGTITVNGLTDYFLYLVVSNSSHVGIMTRQPSGGGANIVYYGSQTGQTEYWPVTLSCSGNNLTVARNFTKSTTTDIYGLI